MNGSPSGPGAASAGAVSRTSPNEHLPAPTRTGAGDGRERDRWRGDAAPPAEAGQAEPAQSRRIVPLPRQVGGRLDAIMTMPLPLLFGPRHAARRQRWWDGQRALIRTTASLLGTTGVTSALGMLFWWLAARLLPMAAIGYGSAAVSAIILVGTFGMAGFNTVLVGPLVERPRAAAGLLAAALYVSALISAVFAGGFWLVASMFAPRMVPYLNGGAQVAVFVVGSALAGATLVVDEAPLGKLGGGVQLWRNAVFALVKLGALADLVIFWPDTLAIAIPGAWTVGMALSAVVVVVLLARRGISLFAPRWRALRRLGRASLSNTWLNNALQAPRLALPLVVTGLTSAAQSGSFYVAWTIFGLTTLLPHHFTTGLYAVDAADPHGLAAKLRFSLRTCLLGGLAGVPLVVVCAHPLLRLFGPAYAAQAATPLQLLTLGYFGSVLKHHYIALCRISQRITRAGIYATATAAARLAAAAAGLVNGGLDGLSLALLGVMCVEGAIAAPTVWAALRGRALRRPAPASPCPTPGTRRRHGGF